MIESLGQQVQGVKSQGLMGVGGWAHHFLNPSVDFDQTFVSYILWRDYELIRSTRSRDQWSKSYGIGCDISTPRLISTKILSDTAWRENKLIIAARSNSEVKVIWGWIKLSLFSFLPEWTLSWILYGETVWKAWQTHNERCFVSTAQDPSSRHFIITVVVIHDLVADSIKVT